MSAFSEAALEKKLSELSNSQQSVQTLSLWLIHHRKHSRPIVTVWERELRKVKLMKVVRSTLEECYLFGKKDLFMKMMY
uniref:Regulation of nuclear pre-mRNA domain containing 1A n=1 Tax=Equus caballus TaxID=9796 RepID=A0A9L0T988_HORSE